MNNDNADGTHRQGRPWSLTARALATAIATLSLALPLAAYGQASGAGSASPRGSALLYATQAQKALAYSRCMRAHGVPTFPDPSSAGALPKLSPQQLDNPRFQAAERACQSLLPPGSNDMFPPGEVQQLLVGMVRFSACMRSHGVANWPDPTTDAQGRPMFPLSTAGISRQQAKSVRVTDAAHTCRRLMPAALGGIPVG
ncbi:MAG TPA: hypothetical protein VGG41_16020 [Solirubrobacteraceae bacterium]|jgi:hypothetical protein